MFQSTLAQIRSLVSSGRKGLKTNPLGFFAVCSFLIIAFLVVFGTARAQNLGFGGKTLWDWMELLLVPSMLALGVAWLNWSQNRTERELAERREQESILRDYFDSMKSILFEHEDALRKASEPYTVNSVARTLTLTTARRLRPDLKVYVLNFLLETDLINSGKGTVIGLANIDLEGAELASGYFPNIYLRSANLKRANLEDAVLSYSNLKNAVLDEANLSNADLRHANLSRASLRRANLRGALLDGVNWESTYLEDTIMSDGSINTGEMAGIAAEP